MQTIDVIKELLKDIADVDEASVNEDSTLDSLGLDSIDIAELICNLEDRLNIDFGNPSNITTIGDVVKHIESL